jgi:hypothetical protein
MHVVCPKCAFRNTVVPEYKVGSVLACVCGAFLEFVGPDKPPKVVPEDRRLWSPPSSAHKRPV